MVRDESNPLQEIFDNSTDLTVHIRLVFSSKDIVAQWESEVDDRGVSKLEKTLNLTTTINLTNMYLFDENQRLSKYNSPDEIIDSYFPVRLEAYRRRRAYKLDQLTAHLRKADSKIRYIRDVMNGDIDLRNRAESDIDQMLMHRNLIQIDQSFRYLTEMPMNSVSAPKLETLRKEYEKLDREVTELTAKTPEQLWAQDLDQFEEMYEVYHRKRCFPYEEEARLKKVGKTARPTRPASEVKYPNKRPKKK
jgi:DNA topoisomerase-2